MTQTNYKRFPELYKKDNNGSIRQWSAIVTEAPFGTIARIETWSGVLDGTMVPNHRDVEKGKNLGKANATTPFTQAISEVESEIVAKRKEGYISIMDLENETGIAVENSGWDLSGYLKQYLPNEQTIGKGEKIPQPMLAHKYCSDGSQSGAKDLKKLKIEGKLIYVQPKIDGLRCITKIGFDGREPYVEFYSRTGEKYSGLRKLNDEIVYLTKKMVEANLCRADDDNVIWLDGELYTDKVSFNALNGNLRRNKSSSDVDDSIVYNIFDVIKKEEPFKHRFGRLNKIDHMLSLHVFNHVRVVETQSIYAYEDVLKRLHGIFVERGHEGLMIRLPEGLYEFKRSWKLLKMKEFEDEEFIILGFEEDRRGGMVGAIRVTPLSDPRGTNEENTFKATPKFNLQERKEMWENYTQYMGVKVTVEYFGKSEYGIPRFPRATKIHT